MSQFFLIIKGKIRFFVFTVLLFGLVSVPFIFTKVVRTLVNIVDSVLSKLPAFWMTELVLNAITKRQNPNQNLNQKTLLKSGFVPNIQKSTWKPSKILTWLGKEI